jgi:hypothetical protein
MISIEELFGPVERKQCSTSNPKVELPDLDKKITRPIRKIPTQNRKNKTRNPATRKSSRQQMYPIQKGNLYKKLIFKTDSFSMLFPDVLFAVFGRLTDFYKDRSFYNNKGRHSGGGGGVENVYEPELKIALMLNIN